MTPSKFLISFKYFTLIFTTVTFLTSDELHQFTTKQSLTRNTGRWSRWHTTISPLRHKSSIYYLTFIFKVKENSNIVNPVIWERDYCCTSHFWHHGAPNFDCNWQMKYSFRPHKALYCTWNSCWVLASILRPTGMHQWHSPISTLIMLLLGQCNNAINSYTQYS